MAVPNRTIAAAQRLLKAHSRARVAELLGISEGLVYEIQTGRRQLRLGFDDGPDLDLPAAVARRPTIRCPGCGSSLVDDEACVGCRTANHHSLADKVRHAIRTLPRDEVSRIVRRSATILDRPLGELTRRTFAHVRKKAGLA